MSTAGKVLVILVALSTVVWITLAAGVDQLNTNGAKALHDLSEQVIKAEADLAATQHDISLFRDQTAHIQEQVDRDLTLLRERLADVEKARSQILEHLTRLQYEVATVEETIKAAQTDLEHRTAEKQAEEKALADAKAEVQTLMAGSSQLMTELAGLQETFRAKYHENVELLGKSR